MALREKASHIKLRKPHPSPSFFSRLPKQLIFVLLFVGFVLLLFMYMCVFAVCEQVKSRTEVGNESSRVRVTRGGEPPKVCAGNQTLVLCKNSKCSDDPTLESPVCFGLVCLGLLYT